MAQSPFKTLEFKALFAHWNERLKESGHTEIEDFTMRNPLLKSWHNLKLKCYQGDLDLRIRQTQAYFALAIEATETLTFEKLIYRKIWLLHCEGYSIREIAKFFHNPKKKRTGMGRDRVHFILVSLQKQAGLK